MWCFVRRETRPEADFHCSLYPLPSLSCSSVGTSFRSTNLWLFCLVCFPSRASHHSPNKLSAFGGFGISRGGPAPPAGSLEDVSWFTPTTWTCLKSGEGEENLGGEGRAVSPSFQSPSPCLTFAAPLRGLVNRNSECRFIPLLLGVQGCSWGRGWHRSLSTELP